MKQYIVDAFTDKVFEGNPAAVCVMEKWLPDDVMQKIAIENNLSETAFAVKEEEGYRLRWFTPGKEVDLCGHATLGTAFVLANFYDTDKTHFVWAEKLGKKSMVARQVSKRGGTLFCEDCGDRVLIKGKAALYSEADIYTGVLT